MLDPNEPVYQKTLGNGLTLRTAASLAEIDRVAQINDLIHEPGVGEMTRKLFTQHPDTTGRDLVYIENERGEAIASICLIPWTLCFGGVDLPVAELGIVGTLERYRERGLNRSLMDYFWLRCHERGALLSIIQGIPYFYRQYGYEYAMLPLEGGWRIQPDQIPAPLVMGYTTRPASPADIPLLSRLYQEQARTLDLSARRREGVWQYLLTRTPSPEGMQHDTLILEGPSGETVGYFRIPDFHFNQNLLTIDEVSEVDFLTGLAVMDQLKKLAAARAKDGIRLNLPRESGLVRLARSFGAQDMGTYSWQIAIPDPIAFLSHIGPLLEKRLSGSLFAGWTGTISLNLYKKVISLTFNHGRLEGVERGAAGGQTILSIPPHQFIPLAMGGRSIDEIHALFPDAVAASMAGTEPGAGAEGAWRLMVDTLFPKVSAFLSTIY